MDNASKALIMAGAILIAVALVSLGVYLYQSAASKVTDGTRQVDASQMLMLNSEIEKYCGTNVKGSELTQLARVIKADNANLIFPTDLYLKPANSTTLSGVDETFRSSAVYTVNAVYGTSGNTNGWIIGVTYSTTSATSATSAPAPAHT